MSRLKSENELESLKAQERALQQRIKEVEAREKAKKAADDHRRWQLAGQAAVQHMQAAPDSEFFKTMMGLLNEHARSASDRSLFGLGSKTPNGTDRHEHGSGQLPGANVNSD